ncbi:unnamed protein product [Merluccius merluccius]
MWLRVGLLLLVQTLRLVRGEDCASRFQDGRVDFVLDAETSVGRGARIISSASQLPKADCVEACCLLPHCNVVLLEEKDGGSTCSLFNCLYKQEFVCRFVRKKGFSSFVLRSVYQSHLEGPQTPGDTAGPVAVAGRDVVTSPDQKVTLSGIESQAPADATITAYKWTFVKGDPAVVMETTGDQLLVSNLKPGPYVFQLQVTDSNSRSDAARVDVLVLDEDGSDMYCLVPQEVGVCRASFHRWFYNAAALRCDEFIYGGCKGNRNNFLSEKECSAACANVKAPTQRTVHRPDMEERCTKPCVKGQFRCASGCCVDKSLECDGAPQCSDASDESACSQLNKTFTSLLKVSFNDNLAHCTEPPKVGSCREERSAWYYNPHQQECHNFTYSGCHGNDNNFGSKATCETTCKGVTEKAVFAPGMFGELEETESGSIAIAIVLAVSILVLVAVLAFFFLKGKKMRQRPWPAMAAVPLNDGSEGDTVVYRSTTKSI